MSAELATQRSVHDLEIIASRAAKSRLFGMDADQIFTLCLLAEAEGMPAISALRRFHIIEGKPSMRADAMQAEFQRSGGRVEWLESDEHQCAAMFYHKEYAPKGFRVVVTFEDMKRAGITQGRDGLKKNWKQFPRQMLRARAISEGVRAVNPSVVVGIYTPEEVSDFEPELKRVNASVAEAPKIHPDAEGMHNAAAFFEKASAGDGKDWASRKVAEQTAKYQPPTASAEPIADGEEPYQAYLFNTVQQANDFWRLVNVTGGLPEPQPVVNMFAVENHLGTWAEEAGRIKPDYLKGANGTRSRTKLRNFLAKWYGKYRAEFEGLTEVYLSEKLEEALAKSGLKSIEGGDDADVPDELAAAVDGPAES